MSDACEIYLSIKVGQNTQIPVAVHRNSTIGQLKNRLIGETRLSKGEKRVAKILFAGRELPDDYSFHNSDIGQYTTLHAIFQNACTQKCDPELSTETDTSSQQDVQNALQERPLLHLFFVYCKHASCCCVRPAKLRVRCKLCAYSGFQLDAEPSCWDDVLMPNCLTGVCYNDITCSGRNAEFYFKCTYSHDSDAPSYGSVVVLPLIRSNILNVACTACIEVKNVVLVFPCNTDHVLCLECFVEYCIAKLNERQFDYHPDFGYTLHCPHGCSDSFIDETHHFRVMGVEQYERYQRFATERLLLVGGGIICPRPNCGEGFLPDVRNSSITCMTCGYQFCATCKEATHTGACSVSLDEGHSDLTRAEIAAQQSAASTNVIQATTKQCPQCKVRIEKAGGCMHMECTQCTFEWCWVCETEWNRECQGAHWFG